MTIMKLQSLNSEHSNGVFSSIGCRASRRKADHSIFSVVSRVLGLLAVLVVFSATQAVAQSDNHSQTRPNILLIMTDQLTPGAMSCAGNSYVTTPAMDSIASNGTRFSRAYATQPLCLPFRSSLQTGRFPHEIGTINNGRKIDGEFPMLGKLVGDAGYECAYIGKWHVGCSSEDAGYEEASNVGLDPAKLEAARVFLLRKHDRPFFLTVSFMNPHNICELARGQRLPDGPIGDFPTDLAKLPPLPDNFEKPENEPAVIRKIQDSSWDHYPTAEWDELKWRQYLWGYYRLVEKVDHQIGGVLDALEESGAADDTVVIFISDHGEGVAMHHWNQKQILYDQVTRVPVIISALDSLKGNVSDELVSTPIDITVTILDFIGAKNPTTMTGLSLKPIVMGDSKNLDREFVIAETMFARGGTNLGATGRMIRTDRYKYCVYDNGECREQLFDMQADPGEVINLAVDRKYSEELNRHRTLLLEWAEKTFDTEFPYVAPTE